MARSMLIGALAGRLVGEFLVDVDIGSGTPFADAGVYWPLHPPGKKLDVLIGFYRFIYIYICVVGVYMFLVGVLTSKSLP